MSNYANTKATIAANVYENHLNQVTANMAKAAINSVVDSLIAGGFLYKGVAHPGDAAVSPDANVFYIASEAGTYTNKGGLVVADGEVAILKYNGSWTKEVTGAATAAEVSALGQEIGISSAEVENRVVSLRDPYIWGIGDAYMLYGWVESNLIVTRLASSPEEQLELYGENRGANCFIVRVNPGETINLKGVTAGSWIVCLKEFSFDYLVNNQSIEYVKDIVSDISATRLVYTGESTLIIPTDTHFLIISNDYTQPSTGNIEHHLFQKFEISGIDIISPHHFVTEDDLTTIIGKWSTGGYINSSGQPVSFNGWNYLICDISAYNSIYIDSTLDGSVAYGFLLDADGEPLKQWNNAVVRETIDLANDYPTAVTLKLSGRASATNYVQASRFLERTPYVDMPSEKKMVYPLLALPGKYMHFSVDDCIQVWVQLILNPTAASIFDTQYFSALKDIHDATGACITLNLMCCDSRVGTTPTHTLSDVPNTWAAEFQANSDWLKFSLHSYYTDQEYGTPVSGHSLLQDFTYCITQIERITGTKDCISRHLRLGYFNCPSEEEAISIMGQNNTGVKMYSTSDDTRASNMYLNTIQRNEINTKGLLYDSKNELMFIKSMPRLDNTTNIGALITTAQSFKSSQKLLELFCHEGSYTDSTYKPAMITLFNELKNDYGYQFAYLAELFNN